MDNAKYHFSTSFIDRPELRPYFLMQFGDIDYKTGKDIPLILYTSGSEFVIAGENNRRFCGVNFPTDVNHKVIKESIHYFVIGYRVVDEEFYGRD